MSPMALHRASMVLAFALRRCAFSLAKAISIGFKSGEYFGRKRNGLSEPEFQKALVEAYADRMAPHLKSHQGSWRCWILPHTWLT